MIEPGPLALDGRTLPLGCRAGEINIVEETPEKAEIRSFMCYNMDKDYRVDSKPEPIIW